MPKSPAPRTARISLSSHFVHFGPAARPSAMHAPSRAVSRADSAVLLQPPLLDGLLSVSLQMLISRSIDAEPPTAVVERCGGLVVAVADHDAELLHAGCRWASRPSSAARRR